MMSDKKKTELQEEIRVYQHDTKATENRLKELRKDLTEKMENKGKALEIAELEDKLAIARQDFKSELKRDSAINDLMEEIGAEAEVLKSQKQTLSDKLVAWFSLTEERQVEMDSEGHSRDIILTAKLGKDEKNYQTSLIDSGREYSISDGQTTMVIGKDKTTFTTEIE